MVAKYVRYEDGGRIRHGRLVDGHVHPLDGSIGEFRATDEPAVPLSAVRLLAPTAPSKIIAIGPNYRSLFPDGMAPPERPNLWFKSPTGLNDPEGWIDLPAGHQVNHECELAIVIGRRAKDLDPASVPEHIFGYTCMNDLTAGPLTAPSEFMASHYFVDGKIFDTFAPLGPVIETDLTIGDVHDLHLECRVNGEVRQSHSTSDFLFAPAFVVALVSRVLTLMPGDVISTGSPPGLGPVNDGDTLEVEIEKVGILRNYARAAPARSART